MDVVRCMYPMHIVSRLFGVAFYRITRKEGNVKIERCGRLYALVFTLTYLFKLSSTSSSAFKVISERYNSDRPVILRYTVILESLAAFLSNLVLFVFSYVKRTDQMKLWTDVIELDLDLKELKCPMRYNFVKAISYVMVFGDTLVLLAFMMELFWLPHQKLFQAALFYDWQFLRSAFRLQLLVWIMLFREIFLALLSKFRDVVDDVRDVPKLRELHERACRLMRRLNHTFSGQILFCVALDFVVITILSYYTYKTICHKDTWDERYIYLYWIAFYVFDFFLLTIASCQCCTDANGIVRRSLYAVTERVDRFRPKPKKEIHAFILQLLHNETRLTACGLFNIDGSLIFAVASALTTYLVILIQFDLNLGGTINAQN